MSSFFINSKLLLIFTLIITISSLKVKLNGKQKDYCFTKTTYEEDTIKINFLVSSGKSEQITVTFKNEQQKIIYQETARQRGEYQSDVLPAGDYTLCLSPVPQMNIMLVSKCKLRGSLPSQEIWPKIKKLKELKMVY